MIKDHRLSMRITTELRDGLDKLASQSRRSLANYVEGILADHLAKHEMEKQKIAMDLEVIESTIQAKTAAINDEARSWANRPARPHPKPK